MGRENLFLLPWLQCVFLWSLCMSSSGLPAAQWTVPEAAQRYRASVSKKRRAASPLRPTQHHVLCIRPKRSESVLSKSKEKRRDPSSRWDKEQSPMVRKTRGTEDTVVADLGKHNVPHFTFWWGWHFVCWSMSEFFWLFLPGENSFKQPFYKSDTRGEFTDKHLLTFFHVLFLSFLAVKK